MRPCIEQSNDLTPFCRHSDLGWAASPIRPGMIFDKDRSRLLFLRFLGFSFDRTGIFVRARVAVYANSLDLGLDAGAGKVCHGYECAAWIVPVLEEVFAHFHEFVSIPGFLDENSHAHDIVKAAAGTFQDAVDLSEHLLDLGLEVVGNVIALAVLRCSLPGDPDRNSARRDHTRGKRA